LQNYDSVINHWDLSMNLEQFVNFCESLEGVSAEFPFGPDTLVYKVSGKIFAIVGLDNPELKVNLKCDPEYALELRDRFPQIVPGYHMNKKHWNTVLLEGGLADRLVKELILHSYERVKPVASKRNKNAN